ncbi:hypothetical protein C2S52_015822 [Perilla frutescens var. hirtella]|nr:hypothetical protein C2S52_015822 [Perilla frutescens var. hirtella]
MSFQDLESGRPLTSLGGPTHIEPGSSRALAAGVFRLNTAVGGYKRLVNCIGTPKDTVDLRHNLRKARLQIRQLVKETSAQLDRVRETNKFSEVNASKNIADAKLTKDYEAVLKDFEKAQLLAIQKEKAFTPPIANSTRHSSSASELEISSFNPLQASMHREANRQVMRMENEIVLNEAIIGEREQGIIEIQKEIGEVNEIFRDLAQLVREQGAMIGDISSNIEGSHGAITQGAGHLDKASNIQRSKSSMVIYFVTPCLFATHLFHRKIDMFDAGYRWDHSAHCSFCCCVMTHYPSFDNSIFNLKDKNRSDYFEIKLLSIGFIQTSDVIPKVRGDAHFMD